jgi:hypothetical protein
MSGNGVAAIREGAAIAAVGRPLNLRRGRPFRCQGGIDVLDRVLGNATQRNAVGESAERRKKGASACSGRVGWLCRRACIEGNAGLGSRQVGDRSLSDHAFTLERACDAGIGNARGLKRRLNMPPRELFCPFLSGPVYSKQGAKTLPHAMNDKISIYQIR